MAKKKLPTLKRTSRRNKPKRAANALPGPSAADARPAQPGEDHEEDVFPIVGVGASAGGLEAITELLQHLPANTGMAFAFIQHLDPKHASMLTELLQRHTGMRVQEASNGVKVEPNHVYVIPRNVHMSLVEGILTLSPRQSSPLPHMPIDPFLRSLAEDRKSRAIGIILSGNASDGALGMMAIKAAGGITFAQSSDSAKHDSMPRSAIAAGCVDFVLSPKEIAKELSQLSDRPYIAPPALARTAPPRQDGMLRILALLRNATGTDFTLYKTTTIQRRILRRMALRHIDSFDQYVTLLRGESAEIRALYEDILINVTEFFRDPDAFEALKKSVFPRMLLAERGNPGGSHGPIRVWVPGCSSGEEVYSIAMVLLEYLEDRGNEIGIQIFGTDISDVALAKARSGIYPASIAQDVSVHRLRRFFSKVETGYQISKRIREMCVFAKQNVVKDPPFSKLNLISCRNVLIYLGPALQKRVIPIFHYALKPNGYLLLGSSETIGSFPELFTLVDKKNKIYTRRFTPGRVPIEITTEETTVPPAPAPPRAEEWTDVEIAREADRIVLGKYAPAGVVIDDEMNIVQFRGQTSSFLAPSPGAASLNLLKMTREGISAELRSLVHKVRHDNVAARRESLRLRSDAGFIHCNLEVVPFKPANNRSRFYLVIFEELRSDGPEQPRVSSKRKAGSSVLERENAKLRQELAATKEYLQSIIEEHESANEELRSANEEIQSSNEELQSTNEELQTAKEELQSTNEELNTVNEELQTRNVQLAQAGNDLVNLLSNVNIPIIMLGNDLRIRRFTPASGRVLNLISSDVGRPISDINLNLDVQKLDKRLLEVIETLSPQMLDVKDWSGRVYSLRIRPYRTEDNKIDGVVMVLVDLDPSRLSAEYAAEQVSNKLVLNPANTPEELRAFSAGLLLAQEQERGHLSRELHDDFDQRLALLALNLESLEQAPGPLRIPRKQIQALRKQITGLSEDLRRVAYRLHPATLDALGLGPALEGFVHDFSERENIPVVFRQKDVPRDIPAGIALGLYRITQEALRNVAKHASAKNAEVTLTGTGAGLRLVIKDSGIGFNINAARGKGLGLRSLEERARLIHGSLEIKSAPDHGTELIVVAPMQASQAQPAS